MVGMLGVEMLGVVIRWCVHTFYKSIQMQKRKLNTVQAKQISVVLVSYKFGTQPKVSSANRICHLLPNVSGSNIAIL